METVDYFGISLQELIDASNLLNKSVVKECKDTNCPVICIPSNTEPAKEYCIPKNTLIQMPEQKIYTNPHNPSQDITAFVKILKFRSNNLFHQTISIQKDTETITVKYYFKFNWNKPNSWICIATNNQDIPITQLIKSQKSIKDALGYTYGNGLDSKSTFVNPNARKLNICTNMRIMMMKVLDIMLTGEGGIEPLLPTYTANLQGHVGMCTCLVKAANSMGKTVYFANREITKENCMESTFERGEYEIRPPELLLD